MYTRGSRVYMLDDRIEKICIRIYTKKKPPVKNIVNNHKFLKQEVYYEGSILYRD